ncbi:hypothetical protein GCM10011501_13130 [Thalassotalea profundi]|uniref:Uncharacterized protein n=1 Tax=Thalassotalea profundi TaxID=2036687 RepID=A0ABQ3IKJ7_9GAMM|nr:hypothetical protein GCM10011501_13130 [Thalassotalea profundi]
MSALFGVISVFLYLCVFPSQRKDKFFTFFNPAVVLMVILITIGLSNLWLIDEQMFMLSFIFGGQEISKPINKE